MRTEDICERLSNCARDTLGCQVGTAEKNEWLDWPLPGHFRFGWMPPLRVDGDDGDLVIIMFSPQLIAEVTEGLTDEQFEDYITLVEFTLARHIEHLDQPGDVVARLIEDQLYEAVPEAMMLRYEVEAQALGTIVPTAS
jgi:hypothetical protein